MAVRTGAFDLHRMLLAMKNQMETALMMKKTAALPGQSATTPGYLQDLLGSNTPPSRSPNLY